MQTNCELSKNNRYSRGYLNSNKEIKTILECEQTIKETELRKQSLLST